MIQKIILFNLTFFIIKQLVIKLLVLKIQNKILNN